MSVLLRLPAKALHYLALVCFACLSLMAPTQAQTTRRLEFVVHDAEARAARKYLSYEPGTLDSLKILDTLRQQIRQVQAKGFLSAGVDSLVCGQEICRAYWYLGKPFILDSLELQGVSPAVFRQVAGFLQRGQIFRQSELERASDELIAYYMSHGYPFVKLAATPQLLPKARIKLVFALDSGPSVVFDSLRLSGDLQLRNSFLRPFLGIRPKAAYDQRLVQKIPERLGNLPYLQMSAEPGLLIRDDRARVLIPAQRRKASRFDFLLGILPDPGSGKILLTGQIQADLWNALGYGERLQAEWLRSRPATQELKLAAAFPYLYGTPLGVSGRFELYKRDSLSLELASELGLQYSWPGGHYLKGYWQFNGASLLVIPEVQILATERLPAILDFQWHQFGAEIGWQNLDYRLNPRQGNQVWLKGGAGRKVIRPNEQILLLSHDQVDFAAQYDSLDLESPQFKLEGLLQRFWPLGRKGTLLTQLQGGWLGNPGRLLRNDFFRLGGYARMRGYDEQSILASRYGIATLEYRLLLSRNAYFSLFGDYGLARSEHADRRLLGLGTGLSLETRAGIFNLAVAVGKPEGEGIAWRAAKVHVGFVSLF